MEAFHRFFWTFNVGMAAFLAIRAGYLLLFNKTSDVATWTLILVVFTVLFIISLFGYHMYVGFKFLSKQQDKR